MLQQTMRKELAEKLNKLPRQPGVYIFKNAKGLVLYVGKAINLKNRVRSYFSEPINRHATRIGHMISQIADLDYVVTDNEVESLVLENNFIKQMQPKYNVRLRDDKNYLFIKINVADEIPTITFERKLTDKHARYFGPYTQSQSVKETLRLLRKIFPYCSNKKISHRPCFYYHIGKCPGVCIGKIPLVEYRQTINKITRFLQGRQTEVLKDLQTQMKNYSKAKQFEKAAKIRDQIFALNRMLEKQKLVYPKKVDQDVFSVHMENTVACINLFIIREGKVIRKENFILENIKGLGTAEILGEFLPKYYLEASGWSKEILVPAKIKNSPHPLLNLRGGDRAQGKAGEFLPKIIIPTRGPKLALIKLGQENAKQYLESQSDKKLLEEARLLASLKELQRALNLSSLPGRIEAYDISNIQGKHAAGSMVVFDFGRPKKADYRRFKIHRTASAEALAKADDYAMMREMLERRFKRSVKSEERSVKEVARFTLHASRSSWPLPDLILIDGGKGQLNAALKALRQILNSKFQIPIIGLAKRLEEIFLPLRSSPLTLPANSQALFLLQRIRDEAHRFAITYHRKLRSKAALTHSAPLRVNLERSRDG